MIHVYNSLPTVWSWKTATDKIDTISTQGKIAVVAGTAITSYIVMEIAKTTFLATTALPVGIAIGAIAICSVAFIAFFLGKVCMEDEISNQKAAYLRAIGFGGSGRNPLQFKPDDVKAIELLQRGNIVPKGSLYDPVYDPEGNINLACSLGRVKVMEYILKTYPECVEMHPRSLGAESLLFLACNKGHSAIAQMILKVGSERSANFVNNDIHFPRRRYPELATTLREKAKMMLNPRRAPSLWAGPLFSAVYSFIAKDNPTYKQIVMALLKHGANIFKSTKTGRLLKKFHELMPSDLKVEGNLFELLQKKPEFFAELLDVPLFRTQVIKRYPELSNLNEDNVAFKPAAIRCLATYDPMV